MYYSNYATSLKSNLDIVQHNWRKSNSWLSWKLGKSIRTIIRYRKKLIALCSTIQNEKEKQKFELFHKNTNNQNAKRVDENLLLKLYKEYEKLNKELNGEKTGRFATFSDFYKGLNEEIKAKIKYSTFYKNLLRNGFCSPYAKRKTKRLAVRITKNIIEKNKPEKSENITIYKENLKYLNKLEKLVLISNNKSKYDFGQCIEVDACNDRFFGTKEKITIYHAIDSGTKMLLGIWIEKEETNHGYQKLLEMVFEQYGLPQAVLSDKRRTMWGSEFTETAFKEALNEKNIDLDYSSNPKFKPNVERSFDTCQKNYPLYFHQQNWTTIEDLQKNKKQIVDFYNNKFKKVYNGKHNVFRKPISTNEIKMDLKIKRKILGGTIQFKNKRYAPFDEENNRVMMKEKGIIKAVMNSDGVIEFIANNKRYEAREPKGEQLTDDMVYAFKHNLDPSIEGIRKITKIHSINQSFSHNNIEKIKTLLNSSNATNNISLEVMNLLKKISEQLKEVNENISKTIWEK